MLYSLTTENPPVEQAASLPSEQTNSLPQEEEVVVEPTGLPGSSNEQQEPSSLETASPTEKEPLHSQNEESQSLQGQEQSSSNQSSNQVSSSQLPSSSVAPKEKSQRKDLAGKNPDEIATLDQMLEALLSTKVVDDLTWEGGKRYLDNKVIPFRDLAQSFIYSDIDPLPVKDIEKLRKALEEEMDSGNCGRWYATLTCLDKALFQLQQWKTPYNQLPEGVRNPITMDIIEADKFIYDFNDAYKMYQFAKKRSGS